MQQRAIQLYLFSKLLLRPVVSAPVCWKKRQGIAAVVWSNHGKDQVHLKGHSFHADFR